jgi:chromosome segregation ATPase
MTYFSDTRLRIVHLKLQGADSTLQNVDSKLQIVDSGLQNVDSKRQNVDSKLQGTDSKLQNVDMKLQNVDMKLQNPDSKLGTLDLKLQNHAKTADRDRHPGSATAERATRNTHTPLNLREDPIMRFPTREADVAALGATSSSASQSPPTISRHRRSRRRTSR